MHEKGAKNVEEAVQQFYEEPNKYDTISDQPKLVNDGKGDKSGKMPLPPQATISGHMYRPHTNAVIEAGHIRAQDEVCYLFTRTVTF